MKTAVAGRSIFITGTDTGVGKTHVAQGLLRAARRQGIGACGFKPVASGCRSTPAGLRNADALGLQAAAGTSEPYEVINPYAFKPAIAPHLAARAAGQRIDPRRLDAAQRRLAAAYEWVLIEGAGGWQVPLNAKLGFADWVEQHRWPVLLVVGLRLGCINHALLSTESILRRTSLLGWIANRVPPSPPAWRENIDDLRERLPAPLLGVVAPGQRVLSEPLRRLIGS